jgi:hypothetical protein
MLHHNESLEKSYNCIDIAIGFKSSNLIAFLRAECDVHSTYEGDNTVLLLNVMDL